VEAVSRLIQSDAALAAPLLRLANSAAYRGLQETLSVHDAIVRLGAREVANLVLLIGHRKCFRLRDPGLGQHLAGLWRHALGCAVAASALARHLRRPDVAGPAFLAALLHDVGKLFVLRVLDDMEYPEREALRGAAPELMGSMHTEKGYALLARCHLPSVLSSVARHHHDDVFDDSDTTSLVVRLADRACNLAGLGLVPLAGIDLATEPEARALGLDAAGIEQLQEQVERTRDLPL